MSRSIQRTIVLLVMTVLSTQPRHGVAGEGHAADDELALLAAQLSEQQPLLIGAPSAVSTQATIVDPAQCSSNGAWGSVIKWTPHIPVSAANLPDGRILTFASNQRTSFPAGPEFTYAATWTPSTGAFQEYNNSAHDMFCGGITLMTDGRVMVNGGRNSTPYTSVFDWRTNKWTRIQSMNGGRWYNTSVSLPDGGVFTASGSGTGIDTTERWTSAGWTLLSGISWPAVTKSDPGYMKEWHPFVSVAPDGRLLHYGPTDTMHWFDVAGTGSFVNANASVPGIQYPKEGCSVQYDEGRLLVAGGSADTTPAAADSSIGTSTNAAYTVDMRASPPVVTPTAPMKYARQFVNTVVLPGGEVLVIGGNNPGQKFSDNGSIMPCEIWNPRTGAWRTVASISVPRNYHSVALLLPDGRVWSAGGGLGGGDHQDAQLYTPPCLFTSTGAAAVRPVLAAAPAKIGPGSIFTVSGTAGLAKFSFIRMAALTHSVNTDQRHLSLAFTETSAGSYQITAHSNLNVMTPGYWMLFGVKSDGSYSVAKIIQVDASNAIVVRNPGSQMSSVGAPVVLPVTAKAPAGVTLVWSASGLPSGLAINPSSGVISGTPVQAGIGAARVTASGGGQAVSQDFTWTVLLTHTGSGSMLREWWLNIPGTTVTSLTSSPAYPAQPDGRDLQPSFESPSNWADNMGQRMRGYVIPPVTGQYRFWIAGDDECQLILSTDTDPAHGTLIANVPGWAASREWSKYPEQASVIIALQAGQPCYIEALMKEGAGGDNLAVAWQLPNTNGPVLIDGQYLSPFYDLRPLELAPASPVAVIDAGAVASYTASSTGGINPRFSWTWGDGSAASVSSASAGATHAFAAPGRYLVTVTASDDEGSIVSVSFYQAVRAPLSARRPTASSSIAYEDKPADAHDRVWCVNPDNDSVSVFDVVTRSRVAEINVAKGPRTLALAADGSVWVANVSSDTISIINGSTLSVVSTIDLSRGARPFGIAFSPDGTAAWIACEGTGQLLRASPATRTVTASLPVGTDARHVSVSADGARVFVTRYITPLMPGEQTGSISPTASSGGEVISVLAGAFVVEKRSHLLHSDRGDTITSGRGIPNYLGPAVISPDGLSAWVPSKQDNIKRGRLRDGNDLTHDQTIRSIASRLPLAVGSPAAVDDTNSRVDFDNAGIAVNAAFDPNGIYLFTALEGSREVGVADVWNRREARRFKAGRAPQGIALSGDGRTVFVHNFMDRTVTVHDAGAMLDGADTTPSLLATMNCVAAEPLAPAVLAGKQHFYDSADPRIAFEQYISCAACHNDGGHDGRVWDFASFGEGLRNTISLRGHAGTAQGPVHWTGNFDEIQDFENQLRSLPHGTGLIPNGSPNPPLGAPNAGRSSDLDSLALYVSSLSANDASPSRNSDGSLPASALAGRSQFIVHSCARCHGGVQFTDSAAGVLHDIGTIKATSGSRLGTTLTGLDTPTLRGVWNTGPYLHDGSAPSIEAAILAHAGVSHPAAGSQALADLANYLRALDDAETTSPPILQASVVSDRAVVTEKNFAITITFNVAIDSLMESDLHTTNSSVLGISGAGTTWVATLQADAAGPIEVRLTKNGLEAQSNAITYDPPAPFIAKINFQPAGAPVPEGYVPDVGLPYAPRNGLIHGWNADQANRMRDRNQELDQRLDTLAIVRDPAAWELAVPAGEYDVTIGIGDPASACTVTLNIEGVPAWSGERFASRDYQTRTIRVPVSDGRLTIDNGSAATGDLCISYIDVVAAGAGADARRGYGLAAAYYAGKNFNQLRLTRVDSVIDSDWRGFAPDARVPADGFSVRWQGRVVPRYSEPYTFMTTSDDGVRLWVNDRLIIDHWSDHGVSQDAGAVTLIAGVAVAIRMEYYDSLGSASARLEWQSQTQAREVVPNERLRADPLIYGSTFGAWAASGRSAGNGPLADSDGDGTADLLEYALGGSGYSGVDPGGGLRVETGRGGEIIARVSRVRAVSDVRFDLEGSDDFREWTAEAAAPVAVIIGDEMEEMKWVNPVHRLLRLRVTLTGGASVTTAPVTVQRLGLNPGFQTIGIASLRSALFSGQVESVAGDSLMLRDNASLRAAIDADSTCYIEVRDGPFAGHRLDIASVEDRSVTLNPYATCNTLGFTPAGLAGANIVVRPHVTLASAFDPDSMPGAPGAATAEQIMLYQNEGYVIYWLSNGGSNPSRRGWYRAGDVSGQSANGVIIPPGAGLLAKMPSGGRSISVVGQVRTNPFVQRLVTGHNLICSPWPQDQSPASMGAMNPAVFAGGSTASQTDRIERWNGDSSPGASGYTIYWLQDNHAGIRRWLAAGVVGGAAVDQEILLPMNRSVFVKAQAATAANTWTLMPPAM